MDIQILEEFVSLVETCSFQETAERMHISQSSLTKHIHKLEEELNVTFFDRSTRSVQLNLYSQAFYPYAKQILDLNSQAMQELKDIENENKNKLRIAFTPSLGQYGIVELLSSFSRRHPQYEIEMTETPHVVEVTSSHHSDFGFLPEDETITNNMNQLIYCADHLVVVLSDANPLCEQPFLTIEQIAEEPLILHTNPSGNQYLETRKLLNQFEEKQLTHTIIANISNIHTILRMVREDQGIAILNRYAIPNDFPDIKVLDIRPEMSFNIYAIYPNKIKKSAPVSSFLRFLVEYITQEQADEE